MTDDGSMNQKQRQSVLTTVKENPKVRVILMSFKAGGVGQILPITAPLAQFDVVAQD